VQVPAAIIETVLPLIVQIDWVAEVNATAKLEDAIALTEKGASL